MCTGAVDVIVAVVPGLLGDDAATLVGRDLVPFVEADHQRPARFEHIAGDAGVLLGNAVRGIDQQDADMGLIDRLQSALSLLLSARSGSGGTRQH